MRAAACVAGGLIVLLVMAWMARPGDAASSTTVVSMDVPSAISLTDSCTSAAAWNFGVVQPGSTALTTTGAGVCRLQFTSSNDSGQLRIAQRDGTDTAMSAPNLASASLSPGYTHSQLLVGRAYDDNLVFFGGLGHLDRWDGASWTSTGGLAAGLDSIYAIDFQPGTPSTWWVVGDDGIVLRSTNANTGAPTWSTTPTTTLQSAGWPATRAVTGVEVVSAALTFIIGDNGWVARTTDNGATAGGWTMYQLAGAATHTLTSITVDPGNPNKLVILDPAVSPRLHYTTTGGPNAAAWTATATTPAKHFVSVTASDSTHWYAVGHDGGIYTSADGIAWTHRDQSAGYLGAFKQVTSHTSSPAVAYVAGEAGVVLRTTDGGVTWTRQQVPLGSALYAAAAGSASTVYLGGTGKKVLRSTNADTVGTYSVVYQTAGSFALADASPSPGAGRTIVAVGSEGRIRRSTDGGGSWSNIASGATEPLFGIDWGSGTTAWAVGDGGRILRTTDSGATWSSQASGVTVRLTAVQAVDKTTAYAVGESGTILRTTNGGVSWSSRPSGTTVVLHDVTATTGGLVTAVGINSTILRSTDGGTSFAALPTGGLPSATRQLVGVEQGRGSTMYIATAWRGSWRSLDAGLTWAALPGDLIQSGSTEVTGIAAMGDMVVISADSARIQVSYDAGDTWTMSNAASLTWGRMHRPAILEAHRILAPAEFSGYVPLVPSVASTVADYGGGATWGNPVTTTNLFGVCLQAVGGTTAPGAGWTVDGGTCTASDADPWHAVPTLAEPLATTASAGAAGQVDLVWGVRTSQTQPPGPMRATIAFEAIAPNI